MTTISDDVARIAQIMVHDHVAGGKAKALRHWAWGIDVAAGLGPLAKAAGVSAETVAAFEDGTVAPTTQQALAWLSELHRRQPQSLLDMRPVGDLEGQRPPGLIPAEAPELPGPAEVLIRAGGKSATFTPDLDRLDGRDVARYCRELASRCGIKPSMPGALRQPEMAFVHLLAEQASAEGPVSIRHALTRPQRVRVHEALEAARLRLRSEDSDLEGAAARLHSEWRLHIKWREADGRRRPYAGPADDDEQEMTRIGH